MNNHISERITALRQQLGSSLAILGHHYQSDEVVQHVDFQGDSLELARKIPDLDAKYIVFCGVSFMAETAALLATKEQSVLIPDPKAHCCMAGTAPTQRVAKVLQEITDLGRKVIPLAYVNSTVGVKALCGEYGGSVCTSANAAIMLDWAMGQGDCVLFLPDKNLGMNTADLLRIPVQERAVLNVRDKDGLLDSDSLSRKLLLWPGVCAIHFRLKPEDVRLVQEDDPRPLVFVHPECEPGVVALANVSASTSGIIRAVREASPGATIYIGTEDNLVLRLARLNPDKHIYPLGAGYCSAMLKITEARLLSTLENLDEHAAVRVDSAIAPKARKALETMLDVMASRK
ncbi:quinolinate synthetase [Desulfonatronum thiosulfatophilum]|uniref:quinolinate synthase n=1 Tax=Desulfonatronum thiosulfatophilum TaxID=617002 RepID=A0A1G6BIM5_9BACT|nr:quinolinate synthase NadA [Desulfonatronum thiosulfatophilum]SDB20427.1 quinolinate synthetase [Desulfonatronum thiosulfatophilum]